MSTVGKSYWHFVQWAINDINVGWPYQQEGERNAVEAVVQGLKYKDIFNSDWWKIYDCGK